LQQFVSICLPPTKDNDGQELSLASYIVSNAQKDIPRIFQSIQISASIPF